MFHPQITSGKQKSYHRPFVLIDVLDVLEVGFYKLCIVTECTYMKVDMIKLSAVDRYKAQCPP